jgi:hypothetical protein
MPMCCNGVTNKCIETLFRRVWFLDRVEIGIEVLFMFFNFPGTIVAPSGFENKDQTIQL